MYLKYFSDKVIFSTKFIYISKTPSAEVPPVRNNATSDNQQLPSSSTNNSLNTNPDSVIFRDGTTNSVNTDTFDNSIEDDDEPIAPIRPPIHSKTKNWYSGFCNRWASLLGALTKIAVMLLVNWVYAIVCIGVVFLVWLYVGTANPAVKPGLAHEFRFFVWLKSIIFRCFG